MFTKRQTRAVPKPGTPRIAVAALALALLPASRAAHAGDPHSRFAAVYCSHTYAEIAEQDGQTKLIKGSSPLLRLGLESRSVSESSAKVTYVVPNSGYGLTLEAQVTQGAESPPVDKLQLHAVLAKDADKSAGTPVGEFTSRRKKKTESSDGLIKLVARAAVVNAKFKGYFKDAAGKTVVDEDKVEQGIQDQTLQAGDVLGTISHCAIVDPKTLRGMASRNPDVASLTQPDNSFFAAYDAREKAVADATSRQREREDQAWRANKAQQEKLDQAANQTDATHAAAGNGLTLTAPVTAPPPLTQEQQADLAAAQAQNALRMQQAQGADGQPPVSFPAVVPPFIAQAGIVPAQAPTPVQAPDSQPVPVPADANVSSGGVVPGGATF